MFADWNSVERGTVVLLDWRERAVTLRCFVVEIVQCIAGSRVSFAVKLVSVELFLTRDKQTSPDVADDAGRKCSCFCDECQEVILLMTIVFRSDFAVGL